MHIYNAINKHPLAGKHKCKAFYNFLKWQISQTLNPGIKKVSFIGNTSLLVKKGMTGATGNIYCGLHEFQEMSFLLHFLREEDSFVDVGANIGSYTLLASGVCKAKSVSFEPVPSTFAYLQNNIEINNLHAKTELWNAAAGASEGKIKFTSSLDTVNHALSNNEKGAEYIEVDVYPLFKVLEGKKNIRLIKIDVEGFETEVLNGMNAILKNEDLKAIIIELNGSGERYGYNEDDIHQKLLYYNFAPYTYDPFKRQLISMGIYSDLNTIYLRDKDFVDERIASAKTINIFSETL